MEDSKELFINSFSKYLDVHISVHYGGECFIRDIVKKYARDVEDAMLLMSKAQVEYLSYIWYEIKNNTRWRLYVDDIMEIMVLEQRGIDVYTLKYNKLYNETIYSICQEVIDDIREEKDKTHNDVDKKDKHTDHQHDDKEIVLMNDIFKIDSSDSMCILTYDLPKIIYRYSSKIFDLFISHIKSRSEPLYVKYSDKHLKSILGIILTLQIIDFFVRKIGKDIFLSFDLEEYNNEYDDVSNKIFIDLNNSELRDFHLKRLISEWSSSLYTVYPNKLIVNLNNVNSLPPDTLPHWRELSFTCGNMKLLVCPNGGFINEWKLMDSKSDSFKISVEEKIMIGRSKPIKYDLQLLKNIKIQR